jgi:hypothetical protein
MSNKKFISNGVDEISFKELFEISIKSKKLIIVITFLTTLIAFTLNSQKDSMYQSISYFQIGSYIDKNERETLIEPLDRLINELNIQLFYKQDLNSIKLAKLSQNILEVSFVSNLTSQNTSIMNGIESFIKERHNIIKIDLIKRIEEKIDLISEEIVIAKNIQKEDIIKQIKNIEHRIPFHQEMILALNEAIIADVANLKLLNSNPENKMKMLTVSYKRIEDNIFSYKSELSDQKIKLKVLLDEKVNLEERLNKFKSIDIYLSKDIFELTKQKNKHENQLNNLRLFNTQILKPTMTSEMNKSSIMVFVGFFGGLLLSILLIAIRSNYLK